MSTIHRLTIVHPDGQRISLHASDLRKLERAYWDLHSSLHRITGLPIREHKGADSTSSWSFVQMEPDPAKPYPGATRVVWPDRFVLVTFDEVEVHTDQQAVYHELVSFMETVDRGPQGE